MQHAPWLLCRFSQHTAWHTAGFVVLQTQTLHLALLTQPATATYNQPPRLYCRLMDPDGPNLRRLYTPGLDQLKVSCSGFSYWSRYPES